MSVKDDDALVQVEPAKDSQHPVRMRRHCMPSRRSVMVPFRDDHLPMKVVPNKYSQHPTGRKAATRTLCRGCLSGTIISFNRG